MRLTPEAQAEALRSMEKTAERHAHIQAAFEAAARNFSAGLSAPDFYPKINDRRCWVSMTQNILYDTDQFSDFDSEEYNQNPAGKYAEAPDHLWRTGKSDADLQKCGKVW